MYETEDVENYCVIQPAHIEHCAWGGKAQLHACTAILATTF